MAAAGDSLPNLCEYSFSNGVRISGEGKPAGICMYNPTLLDVARVKCPAELTNLTWFERSDDPASHGAPPGEGRKGVVSVQGFPNIGPGGTGAAKACTTDTGGDTSYCLTRMMDCRKPSGAFTNNVNANTMMPGRRVVQTCTADGYTRIDVQCGCNDCYC